MHNAYPRFIQLAALTACLSLAIAIRAQAIVIETVEIGHPGNSGELSGIAAGGLGATATVGGVSYAYFLGKYEVTNAQYAEFLNAKARTDPHSLYHLDMGASPRGGILRSGTDGSYSYAIKPNMETKPVNYVGFFDALRFVNWLENGQAGGDTESGTYLLEAGTGVARSPNANWFLPNENEWYKAAYFDPTLNGNTGGYFDFATRSNLPPTPASSSSTGVISNAGPNVANYLYRADWNSQEGNVTSVGSAGPLSASYYGTFDQSGNVWEWNETRFGTNGRGLRGGSWDDVADSLISETRMSYDALSERNERFIGFRVGSSLSAVPPVVGDFNRSGVLDPGDIDLLSFEVRTNSRNTAFDLTGDGQINDDDRGRWINVLANTYFGDANFDGEFNSGDFVLVFQSGRYEDQLPNNAGWIHGDWNGDGDFDSSDFVAVFQPLGYEQGPRSSGDFDHDGVLGATDIDLLSDEVRRGSHSADFDLTNDGLVDSRDRDVWVNDIKHTFYGDSDLDGQFTTTDLVAVFQAGKYETGVQSSAGWSDGDWNGDQEFGTGDLILAFQSGGYESGPRALVSVRTVPEPSALITGALCFGIVAFRCRASTLPRMSLRRG